MPAQALMREARAGDVDRAGDDRRQQLVDERAGRGGVDVGQQDAELVAADAGQRAALAERRPSRRVATASSTASPAAVP